ncbi:unnamed protein product [Clonostachys chloroleuca]|uniref:Uncharacterized protein n=1 Tax=Clonostachys chloroleuca TaxID=1926264 RepID=A0AA35M5M2_9HYPO|nr:unnamed protein product [Clonostachys chloroleuca]
MSWHEQTIETNGSISICIYAFSFAAPNIIRQLEYSAANAQILTIPIYLVGGDRNIWSCQDLRPTQRPLALRYHMILHLWCLTYAFLFCIPAGLYPAVIGCVSWVSNNLAPSWKRAIGMAFLMTLGGFGRSVGANMFLEACEGFT